MRKRQVPFALGARLALQGHFLGIVGLSLFKLMPAHHALVSAARGRAPEQGDTFPSGLASVDVHASRQLPFRDRNLHRGLAVQGGKPSDQAQDRVAHAVRHDRCLLKPAERIEFAGAQVVQVESTVRVQLVKLGVEAGTQVARRRLSHVGCPVRWSWIRILHRSRRRRCT